MEEKLSNSEIEKKLAQLEKMKESNSLRIKRYLQKKRAAGYQNISALIKVESYEIINNERDKALKAGNQLTTADIIEHALQVAYKNKSSEQAVNDAPPEQSAFSPSPPVDEVDVPEHIPAPKNYQNDIDTLIEETQAKMETPPPEQSLSLSPVDEVHFSLQGKDTNQELPENLAIPTQGQHSSEPVNILSRIAEMKAQKISYEKMADILNSEGLKTQRGKDFTRANIESLYRRGKS